MRPLCEGERVKRNFLVVAANAQVREALARDLRAKGYSVTRAANGAEALRVVASVNLDAVLVESHLPDMSSEELRDRIKRARPRCRVVVLTSFDLVRNSPDQLRFGPEDFLMRADQVFELCRAPFDVAREGESDGFCHRGNEALIQVVDVLVGLHELEDLYFGGTSHKAARLAREVAEELSCEQETIQEVMLSTLLRDVGKVAIDPEILSQRGALTEEQKEKMKEHVTASLRLFEHVDFPWKVMPIIRHHHERYDGSGYPDGLRGREIPMGARIVAVVDSYGALTSDRHHRDAVDPEEALQGLIRQAGRQFDPEVVEAFQRVLDKRRESRRLKGKPRILIADEQKDFRRLMKMRLVNEGLLVAETAGCENAMKQLLNEPPDLVIVDVDADGNAAFQLLNEMREDKALCRIPFVLVSRRADRVLKIRALREGVDDYLCKDDDLEELVARVQNILTREAIRRDGAKPRKRRGITGDLENLGLPDIVQILAMGMKSARVTLVAEGHEGCLWLENGNLVHARTEQLEGESALHAMLAWSGGEFVIEHGLRSKKTTLVGDTMYLLMEGMRKMDEERKQADQAAS